MTKFYLGYEWNPDSGKVRKRVTTDLKKHPHISMIAPTGASKGVSIEIPNLLLGLRDCSVLNIDPSGQNIMVCGAARAAMGHKVLRANPKRLHGLDSAGCNPMVALDVTDPPRFFMRAVAIAEGMVPMQANGDSKFFESSAQGYATWLIMYVKLRDGAAAHLGTVRDLGTEEEITDADGKPEKGPRATAARAVATGHPRIASLAGRYMKESRSNNDVIATFDAATRWLLDDDIRADLSKDGIDFAKLKDEKTTLFLMLPAGTELSFFGAWLRILVNCALDSLYARGGGGLPVTLMLSEAAQVGRMQPVLAAAGQGRKYGIRLAPIVWQDLSQMRETFGENGAKTLLANSGTVFSFNSGNDAETAEFLSRLGGDQLVPGLVAADDPTKGGDGGSISAQRERAWSPEKIRSLPERHALVWKAGQARPISLYSPPYWDIKACRRVARDDPFHGEMPARQTGPRWRWKAAAAAAALAVVTTALLSAWPLDASPPAPSPAVIAAIPPRPVLRQLPVRLAKAPVPISRNSAPR